MFCYVRKCLALSKNPLRNVSLSLISSYYLEKIIRTILLDFNHSFRCFKTSNKHNQETLWWKMLKPADCRDTKSS